MLLAGPGRYLSVVGVLEVFVLLLLLSVPLWFSVTSFSVLVNSGTAFLERCT